MRVAQGWYQFNPQLSVRRHRGEEEIWQPVFAALNLPLINEFARHFLFEIDSADNRIVGNRIEEYCAMANMPKPTAPIPAKQAITRQQAAEMERIKFENKQLAAVKRWQKQKLGKLSKEPKWGTKEAKRHEIERLRREIDAKKK